jgi:hypothetical protein
MSFGPQSIYKTGKGRDKLLGNSSYHRSFIILNAQDSGYNLNDRKEPAGYGKLEIKKNQGSLHLYVQELKPADPQQGIYDVVLISNKDEVSPAKITSIQVPDNGRGEYEITFDPDNVQDTGASIDQFHGLAVVYRPLQKEKNLQYPLVGYSDKRVTLDWSNAVTEKLDNMYHRKAPAKQPKIRPEEKKHSNGLMAVTEQTLERKETKKDETLSAEDTEDSMQAIEMKSEVNDEDTVGIMKVETDAPDEAEILAKEGNEEDEILVPEDDDVFYKKLEGTYNEDENSVPASAQAFGEDEINPEVLAFEPPDISYIYRDPASVQTEGTLTDRSNTAESSDNVPYSMKFGDSTYWDKVKDYFNRLFDNHKKVTPFDDSAGEVDWIRVENRNEPLYPYYRVNEMNRNSSYLDHYLVGLVRNQGKVQYVVYGIPGIYSNVPPMSMHGFSRWLPVKNGYGAGYWLLYIDAISGNIAYPY